MQLFVSYIDEQQVNRFCQYNIYITLKREVATMIPAAQEILAINNINWKFIPVGSPYFGRVWEVAVKSMKRHLLKDISNTLLNMEEMYTLFAQIEKSMNSQPLTPISSAPKDLV